MDTITRPINLDLRSLKYPPMAIVSILHRISGIFLFLLFPLILYLFHLSLMSMASFYELKLALQQYLLTRFGLWIFGSALVFHVLAGLRHLSMDLGFGESLQAGRRTAVAVLILASISIILLGIWIW